MFESFHLSLLLPSELAVNAQRINGVTAAALSTEPLVQKLDQFIQRDVDDMQRALGRVKSSDFTDLLAERDSARDDAFVALRDFAKAQSKRANAAVAEAGATIYGLFKLRGLSLYRKGYTEQTAGLNLLFDDLATGEAQSALTTINGGDWLADLQAAQAAFEDAINEKVDAESREDYPLVRNAQVKLSGHLETLLAIVELLAEIAHEEGTAASQAAIDGAIGQINEIITGAMAVARARRSRNENDTPAPPAGQPNEA